MTYPDGLGELRADLFHEVRGEHARLLVGNALGQGEVDEHALLGGGDLWSNQKLV